MKKHLDNQRITNVEADSPASLLNNWDTIWFQEWQKLSSSPPIVNHKTDLSHGNIYSLATC